MRDRECSLCVNPEYFLFLFESVVTAARPTPYGIRLKHIINQIGIHYDLINLLIYMHDNLQLIH